MPGDPITIQDKMNQFMGQMSGLPERLEKLLEGIEALKNKIHQMELQSKDDELEFTNIKHNIEMFEKSVRQVLRDLEKKQMHTCMTGQCALMEKINEFDLFQKVQKNTEARETKEDKKHRFKEHFSKYLWGILGAVSLLLIKYFIGV